MSSTHKISALRSLATKVALCLGIALVASSIAPMAVAPASATGAPSGDQIRYPYSNGGANNYVAQRNASDGSNVLYSPSNGTTGSISQNALQVSGAGSNIYILNSASKTIERATVGGANIDMSWADLTSTCSSNIAAIYAIRSGSVNHVFAACGTKIVKIVDPLSSAAQISGSLSVSVSANAVAAIQAGANEYVFFNHSSSVVDTYAFESTSGGSSVGTPVKVSTISSSACGTTCSYAPIAVVEDGTGNDGAVVVAAGISMKRFNSAVALAASSTVSTTGDMQFVDGVLYLGPNAAISQLYPLNESGSVGRLYATVYDALTYSFKSVNIGNAHLGVSIPNMTPGNSTVWFVPQITSTSSWSGTAPTFIQNNNQQNNNSNQSPQAQSFNPNGGQGGVIVISTSSVTVPTVTHSLSTCQLMGWALTSTATQGMIPAGMVLSNMAQPYTYYAVWSSPSCRTSGSSVSTADARPTPQLDLSGLSVIPAPAVGATAGAAGIDLKGKNLPTVASVTVAGKDGKVVTSTETALKLELPTLAPGSYDIVMKTEGNGSITIQNGLVIAAPAPKVDPTPVPPVVITPSIPRTTLVAASTPVPGFLPGKAGVSEAQKAIIQDVVLTKNVTSLECVGVTNAKVSAKLASARAASICAAAKAQNADLTTSVKIIPEAKVNGPIGSVLTNYNH